MSLFYTVDLTLEAFGGPESHEIEITDQGELIVLNHDTEQDDMLAFMTGQKSAVRDFVECWTEDPTSIICDTLGLEGREIVRLAVDWAEHVLPIFESEYPDDPRFRRAIEVVRGFVDGKNTADALTAHEPPFVGAFPDGQSKNSQKYKRRLAAKEAGTAIKYAYSAAKHLSHTDPDPGLKHTVPLVFGEVFSMAASAAIEARYAAASFAHASSSSISKKARAASHEATRAAEASWQVRHFVHAIERWRDHLPWPDIQETP